MLLMSPMNCEYENPQHIGNHKTVDFLQQPGRTLLCRKCHLKISRQVVIWAGTAATMTST